MKDEKKTLCKVCALDSVAQEQLRIAQDKDIKRSTRIKYIEKEFGVKLSDSDLASHQSGKHDDK